MDMQKVKTLLFVTVVCFSIDVCVVQGQQNLGRFIGTFNQRQGSIVQGNVYAASTDTILIDSFTFIPVAGTADAYFFIGSQIGSGSIVTIEDGAAMPLRSYNNERLVLRLFNQMITNFQVLYIWIPTTQVNLGDISIPANLVLPAEVSLGELGLTPILHEVHADDVIIVNAKQLRLVNFAYDNSAPDVYFWVGTGIPSRDGQRVPNENGVIDQPLSRYNGQTITITLPGTLTVFDVDHLSVWCERFAVDFGHVIILMNLDPQSLPALLDILQPKVLGNCQVLENDKFQVAWTVDTQRGVICIQLRGKVDLDEYMAFGISGSSTSTLMRGSDVTVGWIDAATMQANAVDYFLENYIPCSINLAIGACPDVFLGYTDDAMLIDSEVRDGVTFITYEKPLTAGVDLIQSDLNIPLDRPVFISWAYGRINADGLVTRHETRTPGNVQINFGMASSTCPDFTPVTDNQPVVPWVIPPIVSLNTFTAFIGPSGGLRGVQGITGVVGWGIAWYINDVIIPEITVSRGVNYVFVVNGGNDPSSPAFNHPFYITSSERGGYSQLTEAQQQLETIYSGPASGPLCEFKTTSDPIDHPTFNTYQATLNLECVNSRDPAGILQWTPDNNTPDLVYYQCYTHQYLGWKINVMGEAPAQPCDSQPCQNRGICTNLGTTNFLCNCVGTGFTGIQCQTLEVIIPCELQPCLNGGTCTNVGSTFQCSCPSGFTGTTCSDLQILPCDFQPCENGGTCVNIGMTSFQCMCVEGSTGVNCEILQILPCDFQPCENGGTCENIGMTSFQCMCVEGSTGVNCEILQILPCDFQPCENGGTCVNIGVTSFQCMCVEGSTGVTCEILQILPCDFQPCENGGTCVNMGETSFQCMCVDGFTGVNCQNAPVLPCDMQPCQNGGTCVNIIAGVFRCTCPDTFSGQRCQIPQILPCDMQPCQNGGTCTNSGSTFQCGCPTGFSGITCSNIVIVPCQLQPCVNGGTCTNVGSTFQCSCPSGFTGTTCSFPQFFPCDFQPCENGGTCVNMGVTSFQCMCVNGFTGVNCQNIVIVPCELQPCLNGGTCSNVGSTFQCSCPSGVTGTTCSVLQILPCDFQPCENGAACVNIGETSFQCMCVDGFTGVNCQNAPVLPCDMQPCQNGGTCVNIIAQVFRCTCPDTFSGQRCQNSPPTPSPCDSITCFNGGTCVNLVNGVTCQCTAQFAGTFCQSMNTVCNTNPCRNGATCTLDASGMPLCFCDVGFRGNNCQFLVNGPCDNSPCLNGGICNNIQLNAFQCDCSLTAFTGQQCNIPLSPPCNSNPCLNGGTCRNTGGSTGFVCFCIPPFGGTNCQSVVFPCDSAPCMNGGQCRSAVNGEGFTCSCPASFTGLRCQEPACNPNPCNNGATCFIFTNVPFFCLCTDGFTGETCDTEVGPCGNRPCQNGGTCLTDLTAPGGFTCDCTNTGFSGITCQTVDLCLVIPCENGGRCMQVQNTITCDCSGTGFTGPICRQPELGDTIPPIISNCPTEPLRITAPAGISEVTVSWTTPTATDSSGIVSTDVNVQPGSSFPLGTTLVRYVFTDGAGNSAVCTFNVIVTGTSPPDTIPPIISNCPTEPLRITAPAGISEVTVSWTTPTATDSSEIVSTDVNFQPGSSFPLGTTLVRYVFTDGAGNSAVCTFNVIVTGTSPPDTTPPTILNCPNDMEESIEPGLPGVRISWTEPIAQDNFGTVNLISRSHLPNDMFLVGSTTVSYTYSDVRGNTAQCLFCVTINTNTQTGSFTVTCPDDICMVPPAGMFFVQVIWSDPVVSGGVGQINQLRGPAVNSAFYQAETGGVITYQFSDSVNNFAECDFRITVMAECQQSITPLMVQNCPSDMSQLLNQGSTAVFVDWDDLVVTGVGTVRQIEGPPSSSGTFSLGDTAVEYIFSDDLNQRATCTFTVMVTQVDLGSLFISCPSDIVVNVLRGVGGSIVSWDLPVIRDNSFVLVSPPRPPGSFFQIGTVSISYAYVGPSGELEQCSFLVTVNEASPCDTLSCQNGGTCIPLTLTDFTCACPGCFRGDLCQDVANACAGNQCQNGGTCQPFIGSCEQYFCLCPPCLSGIFCELQTNPCDNSNCGNGAVCSPSGTGCSQFTCQCQGCFSGPLCDQEFTPCSNNPCQNGGICQPLQGSCTLYTCDCQGCFTGFNCEIPFNPCQSQPCLNGGTCRNDPSSCTGYSCDCTQCFVGFQCELAITNPCDGSPCLNGGRCVRTGGSCTSFICLCQGLFGGPLCQTVSQVIVNPCSSVPCQNGGSCLLTENGYHCICRVGYRGNDCATSIDGIFFQTSCFNGLCQNGGTCYDSYTSTQPAGISFQYTCLCPSGFTGQTCSLQTEQAVTFNACSTQDPDYCSNNGVCLNAFVSITQSILPVCDCPPGFAGQFCGMNVGNPCIPNPCRNDGLCMDFGQYFICNCVQPFAGETCESLQVDRNPPDIMNCPTQPIIVRTTQTHAIVNWQEPTATDDSQFPVRLTFVNAAPGALYPVGTSFMVVYNFEDVARNTASCSFIIQVMSGN